MVEKILRLSLRFRHLITIIILSLTVFSTTIFFEHFGESDNSLPVWFDQNDPDYVTYKNYLKTFGHDRFIIVAIEFPEVFTPSALLVIQNITNDFKNMPDAEKVTSLTNIDSVEGTSDSLEIHPMIPSVAELANNPELLRIKKNKIMTDPDVVGNLITPDGRTAAILMRVSTNSATEASADLKKRVEDIIRKHNQPSYPYHIAGPPITDEGFDNLVVKDQKNFFPIIFLCVVILIILFFRSILVALVPTIIQLIVLMLVLALYHLTGHTMNVTAGMIIPILVAVCIADSVHMMLEYYHGRSLGMQWEKALIHSAKTLWWPCLFTAGTTLAGFISFKTSSIPPINVLGTMTAIGVLLAFILTMFFVPIILSYLPEPKKEVALHVDSSFVQRFLKFASYYNEHHPKKVMSVFVFFILISFASMALIQVETNFMEYFPKNHPVREDIRFFNEKLSGAVAYEIVLSNKATGERALAADPDVLNTIVSFRDEALKNPHTKEVLSHVGYVKKLNQAFHENDPAQFKIPDTKKEISQLLLLAEGSGATELDQYKTKDNRQIHLSFKSDLVSSEKLNSYLKEVRSLAVNYFDKLGVDVVLTGYAPLWVTLDVNILWSQINSFAVAFGVVMIMMMFVLKSVKAGLISMVPNVVPILYTFGLMGLCKINLNVSTVMIAGVTVGITVDDTIHYLTRFREELKKHKDYVRAMHATNRTIGTAVVFTSSILVGGFGVMMLGSFVPSVYFGGMAALTLLTSIVCEVFMTPILVMWLKPFKV